MNSRPVLCEVLVSAANCGVNIADQLVGGTAAQTMEALNLSGLPITELCFVFVRVWCCRVLDAGLGSGPWVLTSATRNYPTPYH